MVVRKQHKLYHVLGSKIVSPNGERRKFDFTMHAPDGLSVYETVHSNTFKGAGAVINWLRIAEISEDTGEIIRLEDVGKLELMAKPGYKAEKPAIMAPGSGASSVGYAGSPINPKYGDSGKDLTAYPALFEAAEKPEIVVALPVSKEVFNATYTD